MSRKSVILLCLAALVLLGALLSRQEATGPLVRTRLLMGTVVEIRVLDEKAERYNAAVTAAFEEMVRVEQLMSPHLPQSEVSRIAATDQPFELSPETGEVLAKALAVAKASRGAFDVTLGNLIKLWGFAEGEPGLPPPEAIQQSLASSGVDAFELEQGRVVSKVGSLALDLGGVAKGYAIDRAVAILAAAGIEHASVNAGGDMRLLGDRAGVPWRIGIQHPRQPGQILARLNLADRAVVTSGDYERYFERDGVRYHHILDPKTGYPANRCQAVTIVADEAAAADAMATAVFVLGPVAGLDLLRRSPGTEGLIVAADGSVQLTPGLQEVIEWP